MYTIGQFSRICQVSIKALRHYEKIGLLTPSRVDPDNQYRYYSLEQLDAVKAITFMKDLGIPLKTIKDVILQGSQPQDIKAILEEQRTRLIEDLNQLNGRLVRLSRWKNAMEAREMNDAKNYDIRLYDIPATLVYSSRKVMKDIHNELPLLVRSLLDDLTARGGVCAGAPIMLYYDNFYDDGFNPEEIDVEVAWPVADPAMATGTLPNIRAAGYTYVGPYDGLENAYGAVFAWLNENNYKAAVPTREVSVTDPSTTPPEQLVTQILIPVK